MTHAGDSRRSALAHAYAHTSYTAVTPSGHIVLRVGSRSAALDRLLVRYERASWMFLTAYNPGSRLLSADENHARQRQLLAELEARAIIVFRGFGVGDNTDWPAEDSVLALGVKLEEARELGRRFGQNALVYGTHGQPSQLIWCD